MSFLLSVDETLNVRYSDFIDNLQYDTWKMDKEDGVKLKKEPNLDDLITIKDKDKIKWRMKDIFRRSFFWYMGSDSIPPCKEQVFRYYN